VNKAAWASWNFLGARATSTDASSDAAVTVSYWLNRLQVCVCVRREEEQGVSQESV
jgi:predicted NAD/FAD-binding protein